MPHKTERFGYKLTFSLAQGASPEAFQTEWQAHQT
jgi:hypothetical protein